MESKLPSVTIKDRVALQKQYMIGHKKVTDPFIGKKIGEGEYGKIYEARYDVKGKKIPFVIKIASASTYDMRFIDKKYNKDALKREVYVESASGQLISQLVLQKICPHFPLIYFDDITKTCQDKYPGLSEFPRCYTSHQEYIKGITLEKWAQRRHTTRQWYNAFFQILAALHALQYHFNMTHSDLHAENIMVKRIKPGGYWKYKIDGKTYYVENIGLVFYIIDFGFSWIPQRSDIGGFYIHWHHKGNVRLKESERMLFDINHIKYILEYDASKKFTQNLLDIIDELTDTKSKNVLISIKDIISHLFAGNTGEKTCKNHWECMHLKKFVSGPLLETYNLDKKIDKNKLPIQLRGFIIN